MNRLKVAIIVTLGAAVFVTANGTAGARPSENGGDREFQLRRRATLLQQGRLKEAAAVTGRVVQDLAFPESIVMDYETFVRISDGIFVGRVRRGQSSLSVDGSRIATAYAFDVEEWLYGPYKGAQTTVVVPGGRVGFRDGSWAESRLHQFALPTSGQRYFVSVSAEHRRPGLELVPMSSAMGIFELSHLGASLFEIASSGRILPHGSKFGLTAAARSETEDSFRQKLEQAIRSVRGAKRGDPVP